MLLFLIFGRNLLIEQTLTLFKKTNNVSFFFENFIRQKVRNLTRTLQTPNPNIRKRQTVSTPARIMEFPLTVTNVYSPLRVIYKIKHYLVERNALFEC